MCSNRVGQTTGIVDGCQCRQQLRRYLAIEFDELLELIQQRAPEHLNFTFITHEQIGDRIELRAQLAIMLAEVGNSTTR